VESSATGVEGCLFLAFGSAVLAPSSLEFHNRYSEPDLERYIARPGIALTVEYGSDHLACHVLVEPPHSLSRPDEKARLMSSETVDRILEENLPVKVRGMSISSSVESMPCAEKRRTQYQGLTIDRIRNVCASATPEHEIRAEATFNRDGCRKSE
jgi:hypothetical protein